MIGAKSGASFLGAVPDGLNTSTYDFLRATNGEFLYITLIAVWGQLKLIVVLLTFVSLHFKHI